MRVVVNEVRLAVDVRGPAEAPKMVLLHGMRDRGSEWDRVAKLFADTYEVFAPDLRGHGDSDWAGPYTFQTMCDDVTGLIDALGLTSVVLLGHSMGGNIAYLVAMQRPDLVERLIIEDVPPPYALNRSLPEKPADIESLDFDWEVVRGIVAEVFAGAPKMWDDLDTIGAPTLLIGGGPESHVPPDKLRDVAERIPDCTMITIPAGHYIHATEPNRFAEVVEGWLRDE
ncbi:MAG: alpha/beta fold hydrolase [Acidimicrobiales bacterium]